MPDAGQDLTAASSSLRNSQGMSDRAIFVSFSVNGEERATKLLQRRIQTPVGKARSEPGVNPGSQNPCGLVAMVSGETRHVVAVREVLPGNPDAVAYSLIDEGLCRDRDDAPAPVRKGRPCLHRHAAADAVTADDEVRDRQGFADKRKKLLRFGPNEILFQYVRASVRTTESESIVSDDAATNANREASREIPPESDRAERIVEQDQRASRNEIMWRPCLAIEASARARDPMLAFFNVRHAKSPSGMSFG